jgi:NADP-dependent 3-hydroxy acid dehydrogenase YdfG
MASRNILITGASSGIGAATAQLLVAAGHRVVNADSTPADAGEVMHVRCDVTAGAQVDALYKRLADDDLLPDVLILNAGQGIHERLSEGDPDKWERTIAVNLMGPLRMLRAFVPALLQREHAQVLFTSSIAATAPYAYGAVYAASKAALEMVAHSLELEHGDRIRVSVVRPGITDTAFFSNMVSGGHGPEDIGMGSLSAEELGRIIAGLVALPVGTRMAEVTVMPARQTRHER